MTAVAIEARGDHVIRLSVPGYPGRVTITPDTLVPYVITVSNGAGRITYVHLSGHPEVVRSVAPSRSALAKRRPRHE